MPPFSNEVGPGLVLLFVVGGSSRVAATARSRDWRTDYLLTLVAGFILLGWIMVEFLLIPQGWMAQIVYAAVAIPMIVGGLSGWRSPSLGGGIH